MDYIEVALEVAENFEEELEAICMDFGSMGTALYSRTAFDKLPENNGSLKMKKFRDNLPERPILMAYFSNYKEIDALIKYLTINCKAYFETDKLRIIAIEEKDNAAWQTTWKAYYKPIQISRFMHIIPSWHEENKHDEEVSLKIYLDPDQAFGSGDHPTTALALQLLSTYIKKSSKVIDVGTGSGILAIAASKLGASKVLATDIDDKAIAIAKANAEKNLVEPMISFKVADGIGEITFQADLIIANILAPILLSVIDEANYLLNPGGQLILSGIYGPAIKEIEDSVEKAGFHIIQKNQVNDWYGLYVVKR